jgi:FMN phosphatase YigB (HAD superfamily)
MKSIIFDVDGTLNCNQEELRKNREEKIMEFLKNNGKEYLRLKKNGISTIQSFGILGYKKEDLYNICDILRWLKPTAS